MTRNEYLQSPHLYAVRGRALPQTKLTPLDVEAIREAARLRDKLRRRVWAALSNAALANRFRASDSAIERAMRGEATAELIACDVAQIQASRLHRERFLARVTEELGNEALAAKFGVHRRTVEKVLAGETHWV